MGCAHAGPFISFPARPHTRSWDRLGRCVQQKESCLLRIVGAGIQDSCVGTTRLHGGASASEDMDEIVMSCNLLRRGTISRVSRAVLSMLELLIAVDGS